MTTNIIKIGCACGWWFVITEHMAKKVIDCPRCFAKLPDGEEEVNGN